MFVVKANAYGHGLKEVINITKELPIINYYAVDSVYEALIVKEIDVGKKIIIIGWSDEEELESLIMNGFETVAPSMNFLKKVCRVVEKFSSQFLQIQYLILKFDSLVQYSSCSYISRKEK